MRNKIIFTVLILVLAGGTGYFIWHDLNNSQMSEIRLPTINSKNVCGTSASSTECAGQPEGKLKVSVEPVKTPDLDRKIVISADLPEKAKEIAREKIKKLSEELKNNHNLFDSWLQLGIYRKIIGDYEGASESWEYAGKIRPQNSTSFNNLGDLYAYYLKDNKKAENNFLIALKNGPDQVYIYRNVYDFYRNVMKNDTKAKEILRKGIKLNPKTSKDLQYLLDNYQ